MAAHLSIIHDSLGPLREVSKVENARAAMLVGGLPSRHGTVNVTNVTYSITKK
jgi:hypothetical protein